MSRLRRDDERIARLLDGSEPPRDVPGARLLAVADRLRDAGHDPALEPDPDFRAALRDRLLAQAPDALPRPRTPEGPDAPHAVLARTYRRTPPPGPTPPVRPAPSRPSRAARVERKLRNRRRVLVSAALVGVALSGSTMMASEDSLPGQPLYRVKLTVENVEVALARDPAERGRLHLSQARVRVEEIGRVAAATGRPDELVGTLDAMDRLTRTGFRELATAAVTKPDPRALEDLGTWVADQRTLVGRTSAALPGSARLRVTQSMALLQVASTRVSQLADTPGCACPAPPSDELGPLPGTCPACPPPAGGAAASTAPAVVPPVVGSAVPSASAPAGQVPTGAAPVPGPDPIATGGAPGPLQPPLPTVQVPVPTVPPVDPGTTAPPSPPAGGGGTEAPTTEPEPAPPSATPTGIDVPELLEAVTDLIPPLLGG